MSAFADVELCRVVVVEVQNSELVAFGQSGGGVGNFECLVREVVSDRVGVESFHRRDTSHRVRVEIAPFRAAFLHCIDACRNCQQRKNKE